MDISIILAIISAVPASIAALAAWRNGRKLETVHDAVNGGLAAAKAEIVELKAEVVRLKNR